MKSFLSSILSISVLIAAVTCACDMQAMAMPENSHGQHMTMEMDEHPPCDHSDCGNGCLAPGTLNKSEVTTKLTGTIDLDKSIAALPGLLYQLADVAIRVTGPPPVFQLPTSTPITRRDLLLE